MAEVTVMRVPEAGEEERRESASGGCCEPECGPDTCGTQAELPIEVIQVKQSAGGCCKPDCGPETCDC